MLPTQAHPIHQKAVVNCSSGSKTDWLKKLLVIGLGGVVIKLSNYRTFGLSIHNCDSMWEQQLTPLFLSEAAVI